MYIHLTDICARLQGEGEQMINLSVEQDRFYRENRFSFWPNVLEKLEVFNQQYKKMRDEHREVQASLEDGRARSQSQAEQYKDKIKEVIAQQITTKEETAAMQKHIALAAELDHLLKKQRAFELGSLQQRLLFSDGSGAAQDDLEELRSVLFGSEGSPEGGRRSVEESYREPLDAERNHLERERLLVLFAVKHHEALWPSAKVRHGHKAAARVKGGKSALGDEFERMCESGELQLVQAVLRPIAYGGYQDGVTCTPGLFENMQESKEREKRSSGEEAYELLQHVRKSSFSVE